MTRRTASIRTCISVRGDLLAGVAVDLVEAAHDGGDRGAAGHRVGEHRAAAGQPEARVVEGHREPGAEGLHAAGVLGHLEQARRDVGDPDVALEHPAAPTRSGRAPRAATSETTSATIERLTWPSRDRSRHHSRTPSG